MKIILFLILLFAVIFGLIVTQWGTPTGIAYCNQILKVQTGTGGRTRYLEIPSLKMIAECGDFCELEACPTCPPEQWTCTE